MITCLLCCVFAGEVNAIAWWRHQMDTFSSLLALCAPVTGEFPAQSAVTRSFDVFFDLCPNKRLSKQSRGWWFETPSRPLWRHRNEDSKISGFTRTYAHVQFMSMRIVQVDRTLWCMFYKAIDGRSKFCDKIIGGMCAYGCVRLPLLIKLHDDVIKWRHFPRYWSFVPGIHRSPVNSPHKSSWCGSLTPCSKCRQLVDMNAKRTYCQISERLLDK